MESLSVLTERPSESGQSQELDRDIASMAPVYAAASRSLAWGLRTSGAFLAAGLLLVAVRDDELSELAEPLPEVIRLVLDGRGAGFVDLAIISMVLTPIFTVLVLVLGFFRLGDRRFGFVTLIVLTILGVSVTISLIR